MTQAHSVQRVPRQSPRDDAALELARQYIEATLERSSYIDEHGFTDEERIGGELLEAVVRAIAPELRALEEAVPLGDDLNRFLLTPDGRFLRVDTGKYFPVRAATLVRLEPDPRAVLDDIERALLDVEDPASVDTSVIRRVRRLLDSPDSAT
jgi:hypothetical protein